MFRKLYLQVLAAVVIGVLVGHYLPATGIALKPLGDGFIRLIRMLVAPLIFCTVVTGISGMEDRARVGRAGALALLYFEVVSTAALLIGLVVANWVRPGAGLNVDPATLDPGVIADYRGGGNLHGFTEFALGLIPVTLLDALTRGDILQVLLVAVLFGFALQAQGGRANRIHRLLEATMQVLFRIVAMIMRVAPLGAFGAMAFTVGRYGLESLVPLARLLGCFYATCVIFVFGVLGLIARAMGFRILPLLRYLREELLIVFGTSSSESVLPRMLQRLEALGAHRSIVNLVIPAGYSFNLDGTSIYLTMAVLFVAQATHTPLSLADQLLMLTVLLLTSKGAAGVTGSGFIVLAATLGAVGKVPVAGLALIFGIDRFMSEARALTNLVGNAVATLVVARWCGALDAAQLARQLAAPAPPLE